jgi:hypothetical protein
MARRTSARPTNLALAALFVVLTIILYSTASNNAVGAPERDCHRPDCWAASPPGGSGKLVPQRPCPTCRLISLPSAIPVRVLSFDWERLPIPVALILSDFSSIEAVGDLTANSHDRPPTHQAARSYIKPASRAACSEMA